jgi:NAD(P)-dependent dehydrogenase (short-subunit alcohol dehydrogenase family)
VRRVAIVTGASRGIGEGLVRGFRERDYCVIANALTIAPSADPDVLTVAGDVSQPQTAAQIVDEGLRRIWAASFT